jgi:hypothetical protein
MPTEGFEAFTMFPKGGKGGYGIVGGGYINPVWTSDYGSTLAIVTLPTKSSNLWTFGANVTAHNKWADRVGYFGRFDLLFGNNSLSLKLNHIDYSFIRAGKNTISIDYNGAYEVGKSSYFYLTLGMYYRFTLQTWNGSTWNPVNFNTDDREYYPELTFGFKKSITGGEITVDLNNRDAFQSYNGDNLAVDASYAVEIGSKDYVRLSAIHRVSSWIAGPADISEQRFFVEFINGF